MHLIKISNKMKIRLQRKINKNKKTVGLETIYHSGLFCREWYLKTNPDVAKSNEDPLEHYYFNGISEGRTPSYLFDPTWYLNQNEDVKSSNINPLEHYIKYGEKEGRKPSAYFDPIYYKIKYNLSDDQSPLKHYYNNASSQNLNPLPEFDAKYYRDVNEDIRNANIDPYSHFIFQGVFEGRAPNPNFDIVWYVENNLDGKKDVHAFYHYLTEGKHKNLSTKASKLSFTSNINSPYDNNQNEVDNFLCAGSNFENIQHGHRNFSPDVKIIAYYLPQFHPFKENNEWWGTGFTEWTNVTRGRSRFKGHYQPHLPRDLGFYDLRLKETLVHQAEMARNAGLEGFCFYHYWFNGKRLMDGPVNMLLENEDIELPFCIMWANENWSRRWDGLDQDILIAQDYHDEDDEIFIEDLARHFSDSRYIRIDGKPLFFIYRPSIVPKAKAKFAKWRNILKTKYNIEIIFYMVQAFGDHDPRPYGLDGAIEFPPHKVAADLPSVAQSQGLLDPNFTGHYPSYDAMVERSLEDCNFDYDVIKAVTPMWDNEARKPGRGMGFVGATPQKYEQWLSSVISFAKKNPIQETHKFVAINAWNEWAEGAHLEPDQYWGSAYLNATHRAAYSIKSLQGKYPVLLIGHDAYKHGAQLLTLNIFKTLREQFGCDARLIILGEGPLIEEYEKIGPTYVCYNNFSDFKDIIKQIKDESGVCRAICNTAVTGKAVSILHEQGYEFISLIHELENLIKEYHLEYAVKDIASHAKKILFAAKVVQDSFTKIAEKVESEKMVINPQGIYQHVVYDKHAYKAIREELNIPQHSKLVVNVGFADLRKGFDLFINTAKILVQKDPQIHFLWIGDIEGTLKHWLKTDIESDLLKGHVHNVSFTDKITEYLSAADLFAITSREDPFPSVVMEALAVGIPVVGFENGGGFTELLVNPINGAVVPMANLNSMADEILSQIKLDTNIKRNKRSKLALETFKWDEYVFSLLQHLDPKLKKVTVSIPNYNYEKYISERLTSVFYQYYPIFEILVLDDNSSDNSLNIIDSVASTHNRKIQVIKNTVNSGSVFKQWKKGADLSRGEYLWIAEADDLADANFLSTVFSEDIGFDLAYADSKQIDENDNHLADDYRYYYDEAMLELLNTPNVYSGKHIIEKCLSVKNQIMNVSAVVFKTSALNNCLKEHFDKIHSYKVAGDWYIYVRLLSKPGAKGKIISQNLNIHRRHNNSVTRKNYNVQLDEIKSLHALTSSLSKTIDTKYQETYLAEVKCTLTAK